MAEARKSDKKGKSKLRKSLSADGDFIADLGALDYFSLAWRAEPLVGVTVNRRPILALTHF
jgi:hypothetical protein